ncbi:DNA sulfur modification protein DndD [Falsiroseomonas sp. CW058]|uniref:DNA sulfur modification protein DndD n=1 Tax=Falsiroseomonas sp. CW058 TaxID=3388664 RepID=UPI003D31D6A5
MTFDELVLHNFGVYGGRQVVTLTPPSSDRPIVLVGALNGAGKTTFLDALQLCLYGPVARCAGRGELSYDEYLRRSVHHRSADDTAAIEVAFRHTVEGEEQTFRLHRSWSRVGATRRERFEVVRNGRIDRLATEHWAEHVEDFIPLRIAPLFLFDGEKIEAYADLAGAPALIATAVQNLLGLDIVERLAADLQVLERRKRAEAGPAVDRRRAEDLRTRIAQLGEERAKLIAERAATANLIDRRQAELRGIEERYRREGGALFDRRAELEAALAVASAQAEQARRELLDIAAGAAPLLLVKDLLAAAAERAASEDRARRTRDALELAAEAQRALLNTPEIQKLPPRDVSNLRKAMSRWLDERSAEARIETHLDLGPQGVLLLGGLLQEELPTTEERLSRALGAERIASEALEEAKITATAAPNEDAVAELAAARERLRVTIATLDAERSRSDAGVAKLDRTLSELREREARIMEEEALAGIERADVQRLLTHSARVRETLTRFKGRVVERHVARIEKLILASFQQLARKRSLVTEIKIDPVTFDLSLRGGDGLPANAERLSAGERQLLAVAILWGLAKASGRPLPTVIDTPLGRLDSEHRSHLVTEYFPRASHQVVLLSTDEEITGKYLDALRPAVGRSYRLQFDETIGRTVVYDGYLNEEMAGVAN